MQISPDIVAETLERTDIVALISRYITLKQSGRAFVGLCPFHQEKTPSFYVSPERRRFKCFGCSEGGDAISFLKLQTGLGFSEVVQELAREAGISIVERDDPAARLRKAIREANELAARHFRERLQSPRGHAGVEHLTKRGVDPELVRLFGIGYALNDWNDLTEKVVREGTLEGAVAAGLCSPGRDGKHFDAFRGRLMIPIRSLNGHTIAFGARLVEETPRSDGRPSPKYINSRESLLYRKSELLFGLDLAHETIRKEKRAILVEGYFDVMGLHGAGIRNAVALCSTALTAGHLTALERAGAKELVMLLDGDSAGRSAIERLSAPLFSSGMSVRVASLPPGEDPDTFALHYGREATLELLGAALPLSTYLLQTLLPRGSHASFDEKMAAFGKMQSLAVQLPVGVVRTMLVGELAVHFGLSEAEVRDALFTAKPPRAPVHSPAHSSSASPQASPASARGTTGTKAAPPPSTESSELFLAALFFVDPTLRSLPEANVLEEFRVLPLRLALESEQPGESIAALPPALRDQLEAQVAEIERTIGGQEHQAARARAVADVSRRIRLTEIDEHIDRQTLELQQLGELVPEEHVSFLQAELKQLFEARMRLRRRT